MFLNATFAVTPTVTLRAGARYTKDNVSIDNFYALEGGPLAPGPVGYAPDGSTALWTQTIGSPPATFANYQTGVAAQGPDLEHERRQQQCQLQGRRRLEAQRRRPDLSDLQPGLPRSRVQRPGVQLSARGELRRAGKAQLLRSRHEDGPVEPARRVQCGGFHYDYRNQQFLDAFTLPGGAGSGFHTVNAPKSRVDGAEFEFRAKATDDLEIRSALGLLHSKYVELTLHAGSRGLLRGQPADPGAGLQCAASASTGASPSSRPETCG